MKWLRKGILSLGMMAAILLAGISVHAKDSNTYYYTGEKGMSDYNGEENVVITSDKQQYYIIGDNIHNVIVADGVTKIDGSELFCCAKQWDRISREYSLTIPASVITVSGMTDPNLVSIKLDPANKSFTMKDGVLYNKDLTEVIWVSSKQKSVSIASTVKKVDLYQFNKVKNLILPRDCNEINAPIDNVEFHFQTIQIESGNTTFEVKDNCIYTKGFKKLISAAPESVNKKLVLPATIGTVDFYSFTGSKNLESLVLPKKLTAVKGTQWVARIPKLKSISISSSNAKFRSKDGVLYNRDLTKLVAYPRKKTAKKFSIPSSVKEVSMQNFANDNLETLELPAKIVSSAWKNADFIELCKLKTVKVSKASKYYSSKDGVLYNKKKTKIVFYPIGNQMTTYKMPDSVTEFKMDFWKGSKIKKIEIGKKTKKITGVGLYYDSVLSNLRTISVSKKNPYLSSKDGLLYDKKKKKLLLIPDNYRGTSIKIPDSVTAINCELKVQKVKSISIGKGLKSGFDYPILPKLEKITVSAKNKYFKSKDNVLYDKKMTRILLYPVRKTSKEYKMPDSVVMPDGLVNNCHLTKLTIGKKCKEWEANNPYIMPDNNEGDLLTNIKVQIKNKEITGMPKLEQIKVNSSNKNFISVGGVLYSKDKKVLYLYPAAKKNTEFMVPAVTSQIANCNTFTMSSYLKRFKVEQGNKNFEVLDGLLISKRDAATESAYQYKIYGIPGNAVYDNFLIHRNVTKIYVNLNLYQDKIKNVSVETGSRNYFMYKNYIAEIYYD
ncbi:endo-1,4-beta-xylanase A precursor [Lachnospiraceae bacterium KM106-2]|nr:endo-1,4-beta-xylanase A precursor [Lachnospiraceae bacterium KM106-2]